MNQPQGALRGTDLRRDRSRARRRNGLGGELAIEVDFLCDQTPARRKGVGLHRGMELLYAGALFLGPSEWITQPEDMDRSRVPIELRRQGQAHATASAQIGNLFI